MIVRPEANAIGRFFAPIVPAMVYRVLIYILAAVACAASGVAGTADTSDFPVSNDYSLSEQNTPSIAVGPHGIFAVVWADYRGGQGDIYCRMFDSGGVAIGDDFVLNNDGAGAMQFDPDLACDWRGAYYAAWTDYRNSEYPFNPDIYYQRFDTTGPVGPNIFVSDELPDSSRQSPAIGVTGWGTSVVAWTDLRNRNWDIFMRRLDSTGTQLIPGLRVNDDVGAAPQHEPAVAIAPGGWYVIVWYDNRSGHDDIYLQRFDSAGTPVGGNIRVNADLGTAKQKFPDVAVAGNGTIYVVWTDWRNGSYPDESDIYCQRFDGSLNRLGTNIMINSGGADGCRRDPRVAADDGGNACVVWSDSSGGDWNARGQMIDCSGSLRGANFDVNLDKAGRQLKPDAALDGYNAYFAWADHRNGNFDIYGRVWQYNVPGLTATPSRVELSRDRSEAGWDTVAVSIVNAGFGELDFAVLPEEDWLGASKSTGRTPDSLMIYIHSAALDFGLHQGAIRLIDTQNQDSTAKVIILTTITGPVIHIDPDTLRFQAVIEAGSPPDQGVHIDNIGTGELHWRLSTMATWITLSAIAGVAGDAVDIGCDIAGLTVGTYEGALVISDSNAVNDPETLSVQCIIRSGLPYLKAEPARVATSLYAGESSRDSLWIVNAGSGVIDWTAVNQTPWLTLAVSSGGDNDYILYDISGAGPGTGLYADTITISDTGAFNNPLRVPVELSVLPADTVGAMPVQARPAEIFHQPFHLKTHNRINSALVHCQYDPRMITVDSFAVSGAADSMLAVVFGSDSPSGRFSLLITADSTKSALPPAEYYLGELWGAANDSLTGSTGIGMVDDDSYLSLTDYGRHIPIWVGGDIEISQPTAADDQYEQESAAKYTLDQNRPNPFNGVTTIAYSTERYGRVRLVVYNILGQLVKVLVDGDQAAGPHTVVWDGRDVSGRDMASGIFFYKLQAAEFSAVRKMVYLK